ncbi:MAG: hypothetical protein ACKOBG_08095, partial [Actinomycetota bacterium]
MDGRDLASSDLPASERSARSSRLALATFVLIECLSFGLFLRAGSRRWFAFDDWDFLAARQLWNLDDLLTPHLMHWMAVPFVGYRVLFTVFGLDYLPFLIVQIVLHTAVAALLRV